MFVEMCYSNFFKNIIACSAIKGNSSPPEVVGDAGILVDPYDIAGWKENIAKVTADAELQNEIRLKGIERAKLFSWEKSARQTLQVFERFA
jgi:glycosyltransferase involved in cell wall biosynthesis